MKKQIFAILIIVCALNAAFFTGCKKESDIGVIIDPPATQKDFWKQLLTPAYVNCAAADPSGNIWIGSSQGVYISTDKGVSWTKIPNTGLTTTTKVTQIKSDKNGTIFAVSGTDLYRYSSSAKEWTNIAKNMNTSLITFDHMYTFSIDKNGNIYAAMFISQKQDLSTIGVDKPVLYKSTDSGQSWSEIKVAPYMGQIKDIVSDAYGSVYVIMDATVYHSGNLGVTWKKAAGGLVPANPMQLAVNSNGVVYSATGSGVFTSTDFGVNWTNLNYTNYDYTIGITSSNHILVGSTNRCYLTLNNGANWTEVSSGLSYTAFDHAYVWDFDKDGYAYVSLESVLFRSTDPL